MKKTYTKKQIQEAISYWRKQLAKGNYRRIGESMEYEGLKDDLEAALASRDDIPNYLKDYIHDIVLEQAGHDGIGYECEFGGIVSGLKRERVINLTATQGGRTLNVAVPRNAVPLKVTPGQLLDYLAKQNPAATALYCDIKFDFEVGPYRFYFDEDFERHLDSQDNDQRYLLNLGEDGDAELISSPFSSNFYTVNSDGTTNR